MEPVVIALPGNEALAARLAERLGVEPATCHVHRFPDGEDYVRLPVEVAGRAVVLACTLHQPSERALGLLFAAETARELGATAVGLVSPYLGYMRQDHRFHAGEGITSAYFARMLSASVNWLVTVDPHLHRWSSLDQIYSIPSRVVPAAPDIASWLRASVDRPYLIGPDAESVQWVAAVARVAEVPHLVLEKTRHGDRDVDVTPPDLSLLEGRTPVILDDIISTAATMIETVRHLTAGEAPAPLCIGAHAVFAGSAYDELVASGVRGVVTCNTIEHPSNGIDVLDRVAAATAEMLTAA